MARSEEVAAQIALARQTYPFLPEHVRVEPYPADSTGMAEFIGYDGDVAVIRERDIDPVIAPFDPMSIHEAAHAGHAHLKGGVWYAQMPMSEQAVAKAADPVLQGFWAAMAYTTPLSVASIPTGHDNDPVEQFAIVFAYVVSGLRPPATPVWARYSGTYDRARLDTFFRNLPAAPAVASTVDLIAELPRANWSIGSSQKTSITVHWNGSPVPDDVPDIDVIFGDAAYHMSPTWPGRTGGADGIMYHRLYGRDGTVYLTRDPNDTLWHCGNAWGNETSEAWQVMCGTGQSPTPAQRAALMRDLESDGRPRQGHRDLSSTACPGDELEALIQTEEDVAFKDDPDAQAYVADVRATIVAMKNAYNPLVAAARENGLVDAEQEAAIAELNDRLARMGAAAQGK